MQVLEAEVNLREETRVTEQAKPGLSSDEYGERSQDLSESQNRLQQRIDLVEDRIRKLPEGEELFSKEIQLMQAVSIVMQECTGILSKPDTGSAAIAAETEVIELLLSSKRINPSGGGGGGGSTPGGGGKGTTSDSALALIGKGTNEKEIREHREVSQATGEAGAVLPEEYRAGLDEYFNRLTQPSGG